MASDISRLYFLQSKPVLFHYTQPFSVFLCLKFFTCYRAKPKRYVWKDTASLDRTRYLIRRSTKRIFCFLKKVKNNSDCGLNPLGERGSPHSITGFPVLHHIYPLSEQGENRHNMITHFFPLWRKKRSWWRDNLHW